MEFVKPPSQENIDSKEFISDFVTEVYSSDNESVNSNVAIKSPHTSDTEQSVNSLCDEDGSEYIKSEEAYFYERGSEKYKWMIEEYDIVESKTNPDYPSLTEYSNQLGTAPQPIDVWNLLFTDNMLQEIIIWTNYKIGIQRREYKTPHCSDLRDIDVVELKAMLGLLLYTSAFNSNHEDLASIFATDGTGREIFRCISSSNRFAFLLGCLRFDNPDDREARVGDLAAPINTILNTFIQNCQMAYLPNMECCIDEMLIPFKGKCKFKMFMPNKSKKYGLKLTCLTDAVNSYFYNGFIDTGEQFLNDHIHNRATKIIVHLTAPIWGTYRNITADTWFSSMEICSELTNHGLTYVGSLKRNRCEIPKEFLPRKGRAIGTSLYGFFDKTTLLSYVPKENKAILLISTKHLYKSEDSQTKIPHIKTFYDQTKKGVEVLDEKILNNTCSRRARRWAMAVFYRLVDLSSVNAQILHGMYKNSEVTTRCIFLKKLAKSLVQEELERRVSKQGLRRDLKMTIRRILGGSFASDQIIRPFVGKLEKRKRCYVCPAKKNRKTSYACYLCGCPMCLECSQKVCKICFEDPS